MAVIDIHNASQYLTDNSNLTSEVAPANSFTQLPTSYGNPHIPVPSRNARDLESASFSRHASVGVQSSAAATSKDYGRWCFVCKEPNNKHTNLDSYKRHVRKHYAWYTCNIPKCIDQHFTRKEHLSKHLDREHKIYNDPKLVEQSKYTVDLKHLACGFCNFYCGSLDDLMGHVDTNHYRYSAQICDWNDNKVIWTLLSVNECWQEFLKAYPHLQESNFTWNARHIEYLQPRLQEAKESANILFREAYDEVKVDVSQHDYVESGLTREGTDTSQSLQTFQQATGAVTLPSQSLESSWGSERLNSRLDCNENVLSPPMDSEMYESPTSVRDNDAGPRLPPFDSPDSRARFVHRQPPAQSNVDFDFPASATWSTSSSLSSNGEPSSLVHPNITYHPGYRPTIAAQGSYPEMRDCHDIDAKLDSDDQQRYYMQSLGHSQSLRWYC